MRSLSSARCGFLALSIVSLLICTSARADTPPADVGLLTRISGEVSLIETDDPEDLLPAEPFMKVRAGDIFRLEESAVLQIVYFATGRKETWKGPARFRAGEKAGDAVDSDDDALPPSPTVAEMSGEVTQEVRRVAMVLDPSRLYRTGSVQFRSSGKPDRIPRSKPLSADARDDLNEARQVYAKLLQEAAPEDITAELYLFGVLSDLGQYEEMARLIDVMRWKQPANPRIDRLNNWIQQQ